MLFPYPAKAIVGIILVLSKPQLALLGDDVEDLAKISQGLRGRARVGRDN